MRGNGGFGCQFRIRRQERHRFENDFYVRIFLNDIFNARRHLAAVAAGEVKELDQRKFPLRVAGIQFGTVDVFGVFLIGFRLCQKLFLFFLLLIDLQRPDDNRRIIHQNVCNLLFQRSQFLFAFGLFRIGIGAEFDQSIIRYLRIFLQNADNSFGNFFFRRVVKTSRCDGIGGKCKHYRQSRC